MRLTKAVPKGTQGHCTGKKLSFEAGANTALLKKLSRDCLSDQRTIIITELINITLKSVRQFEVESIDSF